MHQLNGEKHVVAWLEAQDDGNARAAMLSFLERLGSDPVECATAFRQRPGIPVCVAAVPGTSVLLDYTIVEQYMTVMILRLYDVDLEETY